MAGRGRTPKENRQNPRDIPTRGDWQKAEGSGWQHGPIPECPEGLMPESEETWDTWMGAWFAAFWNPEDLPSLRHIIRLYDQVVRGDYVRMAELRLQFDTYGISPKGQQDRRWKKTEPRPEGQSQSQGSRYGHLKAVNEGD